MEYGNGSVHLVKVLCVSGYKAFELGIFKNDHPGVSYIKKAIQKELIKLLEDGLEWVIISGQLGVELWTAEVVFELQSEYQHLQLAIITPFLDQEESWNETNKEFYESIVAQADYVNSVTNKKYESPNQFRLKNSFLINKSDGVLLVYDIENPGSPRYLYEEAKKEVERSKYELILINQYDLQAIVEEEQFNDIE
ncbi:DUF1273 domain-containing protein [Bacillus timonensis]|nr:DUF1273 domain-containing protein [Bacillus timonensis]